MSPGNWKLANGNGFRWQQVIQEIKDESFRIKGKKNNKERMKRKFSKFVSTMKEAGLNPRKALNTMVS